MPKRITAMAMILVVALMSAPVSLFAQAGTGTVSGTAVSSNGQVLANATVQVRDVTSKQLMGTTTTNALGAFLFAGLNPGTYVVEIVGANGAIIGTTTTITLSVGAMAATRVIVTAAALGAIAGGAGAAASLGGFFGTTAGILTGVAIAGGITAGIIAMQDDASPSR